MTTSIVATSFPRFLTSRVSPPGMQQLSSGPSVTSWPPADTDTEPARTTYTFSSADESGPAPPPGRKCESPTQEFNGPPGSKPCRRIEQTSKWFGAEYRWADAKRLTSMSAASRFDPVLAARVQHRHQAHDAAIAFRPAPREARKGHALTGHEVDLAADILEAANARRQDGAVTRLPFRKVLQHVMT